MIIANDKRHSTVAALCAGMLGLLSPAVAADSPYMASVAPFKTPPTIDGRLAEGEWDGALHLPAVMDYTDKLITPHRVDVYFGFTRENLYFAILSELPPDGKLVANETRRGADPQALVFDDGVELYIDPNRQNRAEGKGERSFFHYHGNSVGASTTIEFRPEGGPDRGWDGAVEEVNRIDAATQVWIKELRFPLSAMRVDPAAVVGRDVGILVARNLKRTGKWMQATWFPHSGAFVSTDRYALIRLTEDAPTVSLDSFGGLALHKGPIQLDARVFNPGPARTVKVSLNIESTDMPEIRDEQTVELPANGVGVYRHHVAEGRLHEPAVHTLRLRVVTEGGSATNLNYMTRWTRAPENRWPEVPVGPQPSLALGVAYYPSHNHLRLELMPRWLELDDCRKASYEIATSRGVKLLSDSVAWEGASHRVALDLPDLLDDTYTVSVQFDGWEGGAVEQTFTRKHYAWENNRIGITDKVLPPFKPITVDEDGTVSVVLRAYKVNGLGLWDSIKSAGNVSAGGARELLAAPMQLVANGDQALAGTGRFTKTADHEVVYEGRAEHPAVTVQTRTTTEVDGCMKVELTLVPGPEKQALRTLHLDIPLHDELIALYHVSSTSLRYNPAGAIPQGDGRFWDTRDYPDGTFYGNFLPYIWVGAEERGLAFFADNDKGWVLNVNPEDDKQSTPAVELIRQNGVLTMRVNLVQKPILLTEPRTIVFGVMASPAKPMPENWRTRPMAWMGSQYWGSDRSFAARYPRHGDLSPLDMMEAFRLGKPFDFDAFVEEWTERNWGAGQPVIQKGKDQMVGLLKVSRDTALRSRGKLFTAYWEEFHTVSRAHEEVQTFGTEWSGGDAAGSIKPIAPSYRDFAVWWGAEFVRRGIGLYFDNAFPQAVHDPMVSSAYRLPNGQMQPSAGIWARREYLKRIWTLHEQWKDSRMPPLMMIHMTNTHILPYMVWNHSNLDLEWFYGDSPAQQAYAADMLRAQSIGRQTGNIPCALARGDKHGGRPGRAEMAAIHEIRLTDDYTPYAPLTEFGYDEVGVDIFNYWDESYPVTFSDPKVKSILLRRDGQARLLLATWNGEAATVTMTPDTAKLGCEVGTVTDVRTATSLPIDAKGNVTFELNGYGTLLLDLQ